MSEYCEYMWDPMRGHESSALARSIYQGEVKYNKQDKKLAIKTVRAVLREMPDVDLKDCTDEYITRFLLARKYRIEQTAALIAAYQAQIAHRQDIFGNLTARDPALQRALRAGIPGVLPARDRRGRCVLVILASQWDPIAVPALSVQRAIFLVLEILIQDPRNQQSGFVAVVDWSGFSLRQGGALGAAALRNLIAALRGRFPARFKAIHFLSAPLYVQATLALVKPFLDEKTRGKIYLHGNNLSTLHQHLPTDILPAELGGTGPAFNPGLWAEPVIHSAMKEAEIAATQKDKEDPDRINNVQNSEIQHTFNQNCRNQENQLERLQENGKKGFNVFGNGRNVKKTVKDVEMNLISKTSSSNVSSKEKNFGDYKDDTGSEIRLIEENSNEPDNNLDKEGNILQKDDESKCQDEDSTFLDYQDSNSNDFDVISNKPDNSDSKDRCLVDDNTSEKKSINLDNSEILSEKTNLIA